jgi:predicted metalloprotease with PDZ domain
MLVALMILASLANSGEVRVRISFEEVAQHFAQIEMTFPPAEDGERLLLMPVWTPGSYKIRDHSRNLERFEAISAEGVPLDWSKVDKCTWKIISAPRSSFTVRYRLFCFEDSVRTNYLVDSGGYLNPPATLLYERNADTPYLFTFDLPQGWQVSSGLSRTAEGGFRGETLHQIMDSPFLLGAMTTLEFQVETIPFEWSFLGRPNADEAALLADLSKIAQETIALFGSAPFSRYHFFTVFRDGSAGGGLEHANSTLFLSNSNRFADAEGRSGFLALAAHEFFHAWNVKAIVDGKLRPLDYQREMYTDLLWFHEGWTSYFDELLLVRTGLLKPETWLENIAGRIQKLRETPASIRMSLPQASWDAWTHFYQPNANAHNAQISYYDAGALSALALDLHLRGRNLPGLDDLMAHLFPPGSKGEITISFKTIAQWVQEHGGPEGHTFLLNCLQEPRNIPWEDLLAKAGIRTVPPTEKAEDKDAAKQPTLETGMELSAQNGRCHVSRVREGSPAWLAGISPQDEVLALADRRLNCSNWQDLLRWFQPGQEIQVVLSRDERILQRTMRLEVKPGALKLERDEQAPESSRALFSALIASRRSP